MLVHTMSRETLSIISFKASFFLKSSLMTNCLLWAAKGIGFLIGVERESDISIIDLIYQELLKSRSRKFLCLSDAEL